MTEGGHDSGAAAGDEQQCFHAAQVIGFLSILMILSTIILVLAVNSESEMVTSTEVPEQYPYTETPKAKPRVAVNPIIPLVFLFLFGITILIPLSVSCRRAGKSAGINWEARRNERIETGIRQQAQRDQTQRMQLIQREKMLRMQYARVLQEQSAADSPLGGVEGAPLIPSPALSAGALAAHSLGGEHGFTPPREEGSGSPRHNLPHHHPSQHRHNHHHLGHGHAAYAGLALQQSQSVHASGPYDGFPSPPLVSEGHAHSSHQHGRAPARAKAPMASGVFDPLMSMYGLNVEVALSAGSDAGGGGEGARGGSVAPSKALP